MAKTPDALDRYLKSRFPIANPTVGYEAPAFKPDSGDASSGAQTTPRNGNPTPPPPSTSTTDSGTGTATNPTAPLDWQAYLTNWGFTPDIVNELDRIFRTYSDSAQATNAALHYIRTTDWYATTFPGINQGINNGVISNEADYRAYTNQLNDLYTRYYGRNVSGAEVAKQLGSGYSVNRVGATLGGEAYVKTSGAEDQYLLGAFDANGQATPDQLQSLGEEKNGLDSIVGQQLNDRLAKAQQRFQGIFQGTLATPSMQLLGFGRPAAPSLQGGNSATDVSA